MGSVVIEPGDQKTHKDNGIKVIVIMHRARAVLK